MEPLNETQRNRAFKGFLIFFIITMGLVIATVFFSVQVPFQQNKQLSDRMELVNKEKLFTQTFEISMNSVMRLFDSLNKKDVNVAAVDDKIQEKLRTMSTLIDSDSSLLADASQSATKDLYTSVVGSLYDYHSAKKDMRVAGNQDQNVTNLKEIIRDLRSDLKSANQETAFYKSQANKN